jgi:hypothetical protein
MVQIGTSGVSAAIGTVLVRLPGKHGHGEETATPPHAHENAQEDTPGHSLSWLEVLAGVIPWGFKSPSPHQDFKAVSLTRPPERVVFPFGLYPNLQPIREASGAMQVEGWVLKASLAVHQCDLRTPEAQPSTADADEQSAVGRPPRSETGASQCAHNTLCGHITPNHIPAGGIKTV